jgi:hypothetical protein
MCAMCCVVFIVDPDGDLLLYCMIHLFVEWCSVIVTVV